MEVYYAEELTYPHARLHPYTPGAADQHGYEDFKTNPAAIRIILEDFKPLDHQPAIQTFYAFLEWINGPDSHLETNDCVIRPPLPHKDPNSSRALNIRGRVVILFRDLRVNASENHTDWLCGKLMQEMRAIDLEFTKDQGVLGFTLNPAIQIALSKGTWLSEKDFHAPPADPGFARHLTVSFWAYGDDEAEAFTNVDRLFKDLWQGCRLISDDIDGALKNPPPSPPPSPPQT